MLHEAGQDGVGNRFISETPAALIHQNQPIRQQYFKIVAEPWRGQQQAAVESVQCSAHLFAHLQCITLGFRAADVPTPVTRRRCSGVVAIQQFLVGAKATGGHDDRRRGDFTVRSAHTADCAGFITEQPRNPCAEHLFHLQCRCAAFEHLHNAFAVTLRLMATQHAAHAGLVQARQRKLHAHLTQPLERGCRQVAVAAYY